MYSLKNNSLSIVLFDDPHDSWIYRAGEPRSATCKRPLLNTKPLSWWVLSDWSRKWSSWISRPFLSITGSWTSLTNMISRGGVSPSCKSRYKTLWLVWTRPLSFLLSAQRALFHASQRMMVSMLKGLYKNLKYVDWISYEKMHEWLACRFTVMLGDSCFLSLSRMSILIMTLCSQWFEYSTWMIIESKVAVSSVNKCQEHTWLH